MFPDLRKLMAFLESLPLAEFKELVVALRENNRLLREQNELLRAQLPSDPPTRSSARQ